MVWADRNRARTHFLRAGWDYQNRRPRRYVYTRGLFVNPGYMYYPYEQYYNGPGRRDPRVAAFIRQARRHVNPYADVEGSNMRWN